MPDEQVEGNLKGMDDLDFTGWNNADWHGVFADHRTDDVLVDWKGQPPTNGIDEHIAAMKAYVDSAGGTPRQITAHPISFGSGEWTCVGGEFEGGGRMVTVAKWRDGAITELSTADQPSPAASAWLEKPPGTRPNATCARPRSN